MTKIRRYFEKGQICFLTHVTYNRAPILVKHFDLLEHALEKVQASQGFRIDAWVVLPDHMHMLVRHNGRDISDFVKRFKLSFSLSYQHRQQLTGGRLWQYRFWDHVIRDQADMNRHIDYIHHNPVRHGMCDNPFEWRYSSAVRYLERGYYAPDWEVRGSVKIEGGFGE